MNSENAEERQFSVPRLRQEPSRCAWAESSSSPQPVVSQSHNDQAPPFTTRQVGFLVLSARNADCVRHCSFDLPLARRNVVLAILAVYPLSDDYCRAGQLVCRRPSSLDRDREIYGLARSPQVGVATPEDLEAEPDAAFGSLELTLARSVISNFFSKAHCSTQKLSRWHHRHTFIGNKAHLTDGGHTHFTHTHHRAADT